MTLTSPKKVEDMFTDLDFTQPEHISSIASRMTLTSPLQYVHSFEATKGLQRTRRVTLSIHGTL
jgi:hypothetical protein